MDRCIYCMNETGGETICPHCGNNANDYDVPSHILTPGTMLRNRYMIGALIGEGGFGLTYIGYDNIFDSKIAVKEFYPNGLANRNVAVSPKVNRLGSEKAKKAYEKGLGQFLNEAKLLAKFTDEPGIVSVRDFFEDNSTAYIVMEYLEGETLKSYLRNVGLIEYDNALCLLMPVIESLGKLHKKNLLHRDISPDNIMLSGERIKLLDFGAAREIADEKSLSVVLKHGYAPMEQYRRHGNQGPWTDIYALCAVLYRCITGSVPDDSTDRVFDDTLKRPSELGIEISPSFENVLMRGLAIKPEDRFQSIEELIKAFESEEVSGFVPPQTAAKRRKESDRPLRHREFKMNASTTSSSFLTERRTEYQTINEFLINNAKEAYEESLKPENSLKSEEVSEPENVPEPEPQPEPEPEPKPKLSMEERPNTYVVAQKRPVTVPKQLAAVCIAAVLLIVGIVAAKQLGVGGDGEEHTVMLEVPLPDEYDSKKYSYKIEIDGEDIASGEKKLKDKEGGATFTYELNGDKKQKVVVYINDVEYGTYDINYSKEQVKLKGSLNEKELLKTIKK